MSAIAIDDVILPKSWSEYLRPVTRLRIAIVAILVFAVYFNPIRYALVGRWLSDGAWSHGWLIPVFSVYFLSLRREQLFAVRPKPNYLGAVVLILSLAMFFVSAWWWRMTYPQAVSMVGAIFGLTLLLGGWPVIKVAWFPILFLVLAVPLPRQLYAELTLPLRALASSGATVIMPLFASGLHTDTQAVVIDYITSAGVQGHLNVEEACSGMRTLVAFVTLGIAIAYIGDRPVWQRLTMVLACVPIALFCNTIRVTTTGLLLVHGRAELARGTPHQLLGLVLFAVALGLFTLLGYVLSNLFVEESEDGGSATTALIG